MDFYYLNSFMQFHIACPVLEQLFSLVSFTFLVLIIQCSVLTISVYCWVKATSPIYQISFLLQVLRDLITQPSIFLHLLSVQSIVLIMKV